MEKKNSNTQNMYFEDNKNLHMRKMLSCFYHQPEIVETRH